jgi:hypothetical protein
LHMEGGAEKIHFFLLFRGEILFYSWRKGDQNHLSFLDSRSNLTSTFSFVKSSEYNGEHKIILYFCYNSVSNLFVFIAHTEKGTENKNVMQCIANKQFPEVSWDYSATLIERNC